mmetsp:Transcript_26778/g.44778  ORF Transcript_26778/g.44778 Transcript_26778/m.44778 type:complete len:98 (+) Transcript_26778:59-352(+)
MMKFGASIGRPVVNMQRRYLGGWLHKNIRVEENAGIRESSYKTWKLLDMGNLVRLAVFFITPGAVFYMMTMEEAKARDKQVGRDQAYGVVPPASWRG